jgi:amino acid transporter
MSLKQFLFGKPLATDEAEGERVGPLAGVPILGLDALASASYGPEALLTVLLPAGVAGLHYMPGLTLITLLLLGVIFVSYRQTIAAYPGGGGAYTVAKENLGMGAGLFAGAALALDYLLNAAVAISAGVGALVSALPALLPHTVPLCLGLLLLLTLINLRGVRATGLAFMIPTYAFVVCLFGVIAVGTFETFVTGGEPRPRVLLAAAPAAASGVSTWVLLRAFANGCTAMTGVEAVSNGVPIFRKPEIVGARRTLASIIAILAFLLAGITLLCCAYRITATPPGQTGYQSLISQLVAATLGRGPLYYVTIGSVVAVLTLSANTSFAAFPGLCRFLAMDKFLPEAFAHRGRRLSFSFGILVLAVLAGLLLVIFRGICDALIPLFAIGALLGFTMSQVGMVAHWRKVGGGAARRAMYLNAAGALATGATLSVVLVSKLTEGAWLTLLLVLGMLLLFRKVHAHYAFVARVTDTRASLEVGPSQPPIAVLPIRRWDAVSLKALRFATRLTPRVIAVQVLAGDEQTQELSETWPNLVEKPARALGLAPPELKVLRSKYRQLLQPLLDFISELAKNHPDHQVVVVIPELVKPHWYHYLLHNHTAALLRTMLLLRGGPQVVVVTTPWYLEDWLPEQRVLTKRRGLFRTVAKRAKREVDRGE